MTLPKNGRYKKYLTSFSSLNVIRPDDYCTSHAPVPKVFCTFLELKCEWQLVKAKRGSFLDLLKKLGNSVPRYVDLYSNLVCDRISTLQAYQQTWSYELPELSTKDLGPMFSILNRELPLPSDVANSVAMWNAE